ncbi:MAG: 5-(carboxyamino)imidazole ribonucleotide synthase [Planctomycetota bacterium]
MVVGILGGGQLARMMALAGTPLGLRFRCLDPAPDAVAGHVSELIVGAYDDITALQRLSRGVRVVTFEFENVPTTAAAWLLDHVAVAPSPAALAIGQDRAREKAQFTAVGMAVPEYRTADTREELHAAVAAIGAPCVVKTRRLGYDGKGQRRLRPGAGLVAAIDDAFDALRPSDTGGLLVERMVSFEREISVLAARSRTGEIAVYPLVENEHHDGILRRSRAPAPDLDPRLQRDATEFVEALLRQLDYVGVLAVELFVCDGRLLANEMAPRVHNSGHWTIEGAVCSQFENHLRAVLGLPLGSTAMAGGGFATMVNLIGELPSRRDLLALSGLHVHAYGKASRPGRKVGHVTVVEKDRARADATAAQVLRLPSSTEPDWPFGG